MHVTLASIILKIFRHNFAVTNVTYQLDHPIVYVVATIINILRTVINE